MSLIPERQNTDLTKPTIHCGWIGDFEVFKCVYHYMDEDGRQEGAYIVVRNSHYRYELSLDSRMDIEEIIHAAKRFIERVGGSPARDFELDLDSLWPW